MWELALGIFTVVTTITALAYAHHAHKQSVHAPILKIALFNSANGDAIEAPKEPMDIIIELARRSFDSSIETPRGTVAGYPLPIVIRNVGTKTARGIVLRARYSMFLRVVSNGQRVEDVDRNEWIVVDHPIPDLNPKQAYKFGGDVLLPTDALISGIPVETSAMTKDKKKIRIKAKADIMALVEILLYSADAEPVFLFCKIKVEDDSSSLPL